MFHNCFTPVLPCADFFFHNYRTNISNVCDFFFKEIKSCLEVLNVVGAFLLLKKTKQVAPGTFSWSRNNMNDTNHSPGASFLITTQLFYYLLPTLQKLAAARLKQWASSSKARITYACHLCSGALSIYNETCISSPKVTDSHFSTYLTDWVDLLLLLPQQSNWGNKNDRSQ